MLNYLANIHAPMLGDPIPRVNRSPLYLSGDNLRMTAGGRIRTLREAAGLSVAELARRIGVRQPSLWELENGLSKSPRSSTLLKLAEVLNASPDWIASGKGAPYRISVSGPDEGELVAIYRSLPKESQAALMVAAKALLDASPKPSKASPFKVGKKA